MKTTDVKRLRLSIKHQCCVFHLLPSVSYVPHYLCDAEILIKGNDIFLGVDGSNIIY